MSQPVSRIIIKEDVIEDNPYHGNLDYKIVRYFGPKNTKSDPDLHDLWIRSQGAEDSNPWLYWPDISYEKCLEIINSYTY